MIDDVITIKGNAPNKIVILKGDMRADTVGVQGPRGPKGDKGDRGLPAFFHFYIEDGYLYIDQTTDAYNMFIDEYGCLIVDW